MSNLNQEINRIITGIGDKVKYTRLMKSSSSLSDRYRDKDSEEKNYEIRNEEDALSYMVWRMPQTAMVTEELLLRLSEEDPDFYPRSVLDIGGGTGSSILPLISIYPETQITILEEQNVMLGALKIFRENINVSEEINTVRQSLQDYNEKKEYDLVLSSYMINELTDDEIRKAADKIYSLTGKYFIASVPGTPLFFRKLEKLKILLMEKGMEITAPCIGTHPCHLKSDDWCHFYRRVERSSLLRRLKDGELSYEDEKFSYVIMRKKSQGENHVESHEDTQNDEIIRETGNENTSEARIIRHPLQGKGYVDMELCLEDRTEKMRLSRSKTEDFKNVKKLKWGDKVTLKRK